MALQRVAAIQDEDCNWYVIPAWMVNEFCMLQELGEEQDDYEEFEKTFGKYRTGGDLNLIQLYGDLDMVTGTFKS